MCEREMKSLIKDARIKTRSAENLKKLKKVTCIRFWRDESTEMYGEFFGQVKYKIRLRLTCTGKSILGRREFSAPNVQLKYADSTWWAKF